MEPVGPRPVESVGHFEETNCLFKALQGLIAGNEAAFNPHQDGHQTKTGSADGYNIFMVCRINAIHVDALPGKAGNRFGALPEIIESLPLDRIEQLAVGRCNSGFIIRLRLQRIVGLGAVASRY